jgi:GNAT superfamily N-acetyltransferase
MNINYLPGIMIRSVRDRDGDELAAMISAIYTEYPGCTIDEKTERPALRAPAKAALDMKGSWWVAEQDGEIVGSVAVATGKADAELMKLYVAPRARRGGLGAQLVRLAEAEAHARQSRRIVLWTDTRFEEAHRLYDRMGYVREPGTRMLHDASDTVEYCYTKVLS